MCSKVSVSPSEKYSLSSSFDILTNGKTATDAALTSTSGEADSSPACLALNKPTKTIRTTTPATVT